MVNYQEALFLEYVINQVRHYDVEYPEEKLKRLIKIICQYKTLCNMCEKNL